MASSTTHELKSSGLGWCHVAIDQGLEFSFPEEVFFVIVAAEELRIRALQAGVLRSHFLPLYDFFTFYFFLL